MEKHLCCRCPTKTASVLSVVLEWRGGDLPQNKQNGLTPDTKHTEDFRKARGSTSVYSVCREAASVCSVAKNGWHGGRFLPQNTQNGLTPDTEHTEGVEVVTL